LNVPGRLAMHRLPTLVFLGVLLAGLLAETTRGQDTGTLSNEPPPPAPTTSVQNLLDEAAVPARQKQWEETLAVADRAVAAAKAARDLAGQAGGHQVRAQALEGLHRTAGAIAAAGEWAAAWQAAGYVPGQVEALCWRAFTFKEVEPHAERGCLAQAAAAGSADTKSPLQTARMFREWGDTFRNADRLFEAEGLYRAALALWEKHAPRSLDRAAILHLLGNVCSQQDKLVAARGFYQQALEIGETAAPGSLPVAKLRHSLGNLSRRQGDLVGANESLQRAVKIKEALGPGSLDLASSLNELGIVAWEQNDLTRARSLLQRGLEIRKRRAPGSLEVAGSLNDLGVVAWQQGRVGAARELYRQALEIKEQRAPGSLTLARTLHNMGNVLGRQGDLAGAREYYQQALEIREKLAPGSLDVALIRRNLAFLAADQGNLEEAVEYHRRAWQIVRQQAAQVTGDEARQSFGRTHARFAGDLLDCQLRLGRPDEGLVTLEESRAQALQQLLAERGLNARLVKPELWNPYQQAVAAQNRAGKALEAAGEAEASAQRVLEARIARGAGETDLAEQRRLLEKTRQEREARQSDYTRARVAAESLWAAVRAGTPFASPPAPDPESARRSLPAGTLFAAFVVGERGSTLFLAREEGPVQAYSLPLSFAYLEKAVTAVRRQVAGEAGERGAHFATLRAREPPGSDTGTSRELCAALFPPPARAAIAGARRLVIAPDGPLWDLPFAVLVLPESEAPPRESVRAPGRPGAAPPTHPQPRSPTGPRYLGLEKPLVYAQSLTLYVQSLRSGSSGRPARKRTALVVGNPLFDNDRRGEVLARAKHPPAQPTVKRVQRGEGELALLFRDWDLPASLPAAEKEAAAVAALYRTTAWSGVEPTEAWFRQAAPKADLIHLATHGYLHPFRAMSSGICLAVPEKTDPGLTDNDGALQAWEIMSQLKLQAELVVLSACETGLGAKVPGEGLVGLTRALQYAGVRSILASQWQVSDASTKTLMVAFHSGLRQGLPKDEALHRAMQALHEDGRTEDPYYWAAFLLVGDPSNHGLGPVKQ
jgi:tetratricopeptide (TPR) repeat protein